jgi:ribonuclease HIII
VECQHVICNGFDSNDTILRKYLNIKRNAKNVIVCQTNNRNNPAIASPGLLAEKIYSPCIKNLQNKYGTQLPRGIDDNIVEPAMHILKNYGLDGLRDAAKLHMKDIDMVEPAKQTKVPTDILTW